MTRTDLRAMLASGRVLVMDGATATMLRSSRETEPAVAQLHHDYLAAGADIIKTNTFSRQDYDANLAAARLARQRADEWSARTPSSPRFVAGVLDPRNAEPRDQIRGLLDGGVDLLLIETIAHTSALGQLGPAIHLELDARGIDVPVVVSATVRLDARLAGGEALVDFWAATLHLRPSAVGVNCSFGSRTIAAAVRELAQLADAPVTCHPSAGLPDAAGRYPENPTEFAGVMQELAAARLLAIAGGCCGTTPAHIREVARSVRIVPDV